MPYKTLLLSTTDAAASVVRDILEKYGKDPKEAGQYCLVQLIVPLSITDINAVHELNGGSGIREYILDDDDCPLAIEKQHVKTRGSLSFHIKRRPADYQPRKRKKKPKQIQGELEAGYTKYDDALDKLPYLLEVCPEGHDAQVSKKHYLYLNVTEVGSERSGSIQHSQSLQVFGPNVQPRHCVIAHTEGIVTVTPSSRDAEVYVNGVRIAETTILQHTMLVNFGKSHTFKFIDPQDKRRRLSPDLLRSGPPQQCMSNCNGGSNLRRISQDLQQQQFGGPQSSGSFADTNSQHTDGDVETNSMSSKDERLGHRKVLGAEDTTSNHGSLSNRNQFDDNGSSSVEGASMAPPKPPLPSEQDMHLPASSMQANANLDTSLPLVATPVVAGTPDGSHTPQPPPQQRPVIQEIKLHKSNNGMGLSIVATRGLNQAQLGIYIKTVVKGGAADMVRIKQMAFLGNSTNETHTSPCPRLLFSHQDGRLQAGDQLLKVDGKSLVGITQERAAELMTQTGPVVTLEVAKQAAAYVGLTALLNQPSPLAPRGKIT